MSQPEGMNRRGFLGALGGAAVTPLLPGGAVAAAGSASVSLSAATGRYVYGLAVLRARMMPSITPADLARAAPVSTEQAAGLLRQMAKSGIVRPGALPGTWAAVRPIPRSYGAVRTGGAAAARQHQARAARVARRRAPPNQRPARPNLTLDSIPDLRSPITCTCGHAALRETT